MPGLLSPRRPQYPPHIYQRILDYAQLPRLGLAVDLGSGSGQATRALAQRFDRVVGIDASAEQLSQAELPSNVELRQGTAENTGLPPSSVDLVTAAAALHW
jgi:trans-aconitate methyltransferase